MKRNKNIFIKICYLTLCIAVFYSCGNYLDVKPQGEVIPETDEEFAALMHKRILDIEGGEDIYIIGNMDVISWTEGCADNLDANLMLGNNLESFAGDLINSRQFEYRDAWELIRDCNIVIESLKSRKTKIALGSLYAAYSLKGICYYNMMRIYCEPWDNDEKNNIPGLPIVNRMNIEDMPTRSTLKEAYEYTLKNLDLALESFKEYNSLISPAANSKKYNSLANPTTDSKEYKFFFNEDIINMYKARLFFWCQKWESCSKICKILLSKYHLTPIEEYEEMIQSVYDAKGEVIAKSHINNSSELDWYFTIKKNYLASRPANLELIKLFGEEAEKDIRYKVSFDEKLFNTKSPEARLRISEVLLMEAECEYFLGNEQQALNLINDLRENRVKDAIPYVLNNLPIVQFDSKITSNAVGERLHSLQQLIQNERRKELYMEGDRWFELKRNGRPLWWIIKNGLKYTTETYLYTAPIYKGDVDINPNMRQNPGY